MRKNMCSATGVNACDSARVGTIMIQRDDILSMEYLKKTEFTGCHQGMRYRLEKVEDQEQGTGLQVTVWPEPFNFFKTPKEQKTVSRFDFNEDGVLDAVAWMNDRLFEDKDRWDHASDDWSSYRMN